MRLKLLVGIVMFLLIGSCNKKCHKGVYWSLGNVTRNSIPYKDGQIITFKTNQPDSFSVKVKRVYQELEMVVPAGCEEVEQVKLEWADTTGSFISFLLRGCCGGDTMIQMTITAPYQYQRGNVFQFTVHEDGRMGGVFWGSYVYTFHSSLVIDSQSFNDVLEITAPPTLTTEDLDITQLFYSKQYGLIWYKTKGGLIVNR